LIGIHKKVVTLHQVDANIMKQLNFIKITAIIDKLRLFDSKYSKIHAQNKFLLV